MPSCQHPHTHSSSMLILASLSLSLGRALTMELWKKMLYGITSAPSSVRGERVVWGMKKMLYGITRASTIVFKGV